MYKNLVAPLRGVDRHAGPAALVKPSTDPSLRSLP